MATEFVLTPQTVRLIAPGKQLLTQGLEVTQFDQADFLLYVSSIEGTGGPSATIRIITGMQIESEEGWVPAGVFTAATAANFATRMNVGGLLKYVRWELLTLAGTSPAVSFMISGMLRGN